MKKNSLHYVIPIVVILSGIIRLLYLDMDPPQFMGLHFICDEGWWIHNARNKMLFGQWIMDEFNQSLLASPIFCMGTYLFYKFLGVGIASSRIFPALCGFFSILILNVLLKQNRFPEKSRILAIILLGLGFAFTAFNRIAFVDSTAFLFIVITWWLLSTHSKSIPGVILAGITGMCAIITKSYVLSLLPILFMLFMIRIVEAWKQTGIQVTKVYVKIIFCFVCGLLIPAAIWYLYLFLPFQDQFKIMYHLWTDGNVPTSLFKTAVQSFSVFIRHDLDGFHVMRFIALNSVLFLLAWQRISQISSTYTGSIKTFYRRMDPWDRDALVWLFLSILLTAPLTAKPFRRYLFWYPPLIILAARSLLGKITQHNIKKLKLKYLHKIFILAPPAFFFAVPISRMSLLWLSKLTHHRLAGHMGLDAISVILTGIVLFFIFTGIFNRWLIPLRSVSLKWTIILFLLVDGGMYGWSISQASFTIKATSQELGRHFFRSDTLVLGGLADTLSLENRARAIAIWGREEASRVLNENPVERFHPDYIVILKTLDGKPWWIEKRYQKYLSDDLFLKTLYLLPSDKNDFRVTADLYRSPNSSD